MQNILTLNACNSEEKAARRSSILAVLYAILICIVLSLGVGLLIAFESKLLFWCSIALSAYLTDFLRHHLLAS